MRIGASLPSQKARIEWELTHVTVVGGLGRATADARTSRCGRCSPRHCWRGDPQWRPYTAEDRATLVIDTQSVQQDWGQTEVETREARDECHQARPADEPPVVRVHQS